jgi:hypothetical protein
LREIPRSFGITYEVGSVALKCGVVDLHISTQVELEPRAGINGPTLEVACGPPGIGAKTVQESSETKIELLTVAELRWNVLSWIST